MFTVWLVAVWTLARVIWKVLPLQIPCRELRLFCKCSLPWKCQDLTPPKGKKNAIYASENIGTEPPLCRIRPDGAHWSKKSVWLSCSWPLINNIICVSLHMGCEKRRGVPVDNVPNCACRFRPTAGRPNISPFAEILPLWGANKVHRGNQLQNNNCFQLEPPSQFQEMIKLNLTWNNVDKNSLQ